MPSVLFVWNTALSDGNIGSYRPSVYAAKKIGFKIDIAMNFSDTPKEKMQEIEAKLGVKLINVHIDRNPYSRKNFEAYKQLVGIMKKGNYDIIHCNTPMGSIVARLAAKRVNNHKVFYMNRGFAFYHGAPLKNWIIYYSIERVFARFFTDAIATINPDDYKYALRFHLRKNSNLKFLIPGPGVELSRFVYREEDRVFIRKQYGIKDNNVVILSVGEITARKNFDVIINAIMEIKLRKKNSDIYNRIIYMIVGEGELKEELVQKVKKNGIEDKVIFAGYHEDISKYYSGADILAIPSLSEGFGRVGIEAMNVGLPLLTSDVQGIKMYSIDRVTSLMYSANDISGFANGIISLSGDRSLRENIGNYNKNFAKKFSMENSATKIAEIYEALMRYSYK